MRLKRLDPTDGRPPFTCGDSDLDEFYASDSIEGGKQLLAVTYAFLHDDDNCVLAFFAVSNDSIKVESLASNIRNRIWRPVPNRKRYSTMPAAKIGRLGISRAAQRSGIGTQVLDFMKVWFTVENKTGCRFLLVDAYNTPEVLAFYKKNGFSFLVENNESDQTRIMYFDLKTFRPE